VFFFVEVFNMLRYISLIDSLVQARHLSLILQIEIRA